MIDRNQVHEGMVVHSSDGKRLGRVLACEEGRFVVEKGFFFATDYFARYDEVSDVSGDEIRLSRPVEALAHGERAIAREGGLGESFTFGVGGGLDASALRPWLLARGEESAAGGRGTRGDEDEAGRRYGVREPLCYGDEGGGGLL